MKDNTDRYIDHINEKILPIINYEFLQKSYQTDEKVYMKEILNALHTAAIEVYGTANFDDFGENENVVIPGIVRGRETGNICIALLDIDLMSSGEHCDTVYLTKYGCLNSFDAERPKEVKEFLSNTYGVYDYAYTLGIENDIHVDFDKLPPDMIEILNTIGDYAYSSTENSEIYPDNDTTDFER